MVGACNNLRTKLCGPQRDNARAGVAGYSVSVCTMVDASPTNRKNSLLGWRGVVVVVDSMIEAILFGCALCVVVGVIGLALCMLVVSETLCYGQRRYLWGHL